MRRWPFGPRARTVEPLWVGALLVAVLLFGLAAQASALRQTLQELQDVRNRDAATAWVQALAATPFGPGGLGSGPATPHRGAPRTEASGSDVMSAADALHEALSRRFDLGRDQRIALVDASGSAVVELQRRPSVDGVPAWYDRMWPIADTPGHAPIAGSRLLVETDAGWARRAAWLAWSSAAVWQALLTALAIGLSSWALLRSTRNTTSASTSASTRISTDTASPFPTATGGAREPSPAPGERPVHRPAVPADSVDDVEHLHRALRVEAERVAALQQQALTDGLTGCALREPFIGQLQQRLAAPGGPGAALLLVRVLKLPNLNLHHGRLSTDRLLTAVADVLLTYVDRVPGAMAGRLNGADFALYLPVPGVARETVGSLRAGLDAAPALRSGGAEVVVGGVDGIHDTTASQALTAADEALARAEAAPDTSADVVVDMNDVPALGGAGAHAWREQIASALTEGRSRIAELDTVSADGGLVHLECPLQVQLVRGGSFEDAGRWLALARRSRLLPDIDLAAVRAALRACGLDGLPRAVHVSPVSLASAAFRADVLDAMAARPDAARRLSLECRGGPHTEANVAAIGAAAVLWRPLGVRIGVEHATGTPQDLAALQSTGVDYVKVDARHLRGAATDSAIEGYARSLVGLVHGLGMRVLAGGIDDRADLKAVFAIGFDGANGPAVRPD